MRLSFFVAFVAFVGLADSNPVESKAKTSKPSASAKTQNCLDCPLHRAQYFVRSNCKTPSPIKPSQEFRYSAESPLNKNKKYNITVKLNSYKVHDGDKLMLEGRFGKCVNAKANGQDYSVIISKLPAVPAKE